MFCFLVLQCNYYAIYCTIHYIHNGLFQDKFMLTYGTRSVATVNMPFYLSMNSDTTCYGLLYCSRIHGMSPICLFTKTQDIRSFYQSVYADLLSDCSWNVVLVRSVLKFFSLPFTFVSTFYNCCSVMLYSVLCSSGFSMFFECRV